MVLAAGGGSRWRASLATPPGSDRPGSNQGAAHKLLAPFQGSTVVEWAVGHAVAAGLSATWVVTGAVDLSGVLGPDVETLFNPSWAEGQATSLGVAVARARQQGVGALVVGLGDQPLVPPESWAAVAASEADIAVATYDGQRRNPVKLSAQVWDLLPAVGDEGARALIRSRPDLVREVPCQGNPVDIDTREDLDRWS